MKTIEIIVSPTGQTQIETKGYAGSGCRQASEFIELALGSRSGEQLTSEFHQTVSQPQNVQQSS